MKGIKQLEKECLYYLSVKPSSPIMLTHRQIDELRDSKPGRHGSFEFRHDGLFFKAYGKLVPVKAIGT